MKSGHLNNSVYTIVNTKRLFLPPKANLLPVYLMNKRTRRVVQIGSLERMFYICKSQQQMQTIDYHNIKYIANKYYYKPISEEENYVLLLGL